MVTVAEPRGDGGRTSKKYYTTGRPVERNASLQFVSLISFSGEEKARFFNIRLIAAQGLSPQSKIAAAFKPVLLDASKVARWEEVMRDMVSRILYEPDIEPILQVALLRRVLDSATAASEPLREALGPMKTRLDAADVDINIPWMDPDTENLDRSQVRAARAVRHGSAPCSPSSLTSTRSARRSSAASSRHTPSWAGSSGIATTGRSGRAVPCRSKGISGSCCSWIRRGR